MRSLPTLAELQASGAQPHYFGLGFIQLKLSTDTRLHFWVPHWPTIPGAETEIHNHRYGFCSTVLTGRLRQTIYRLGDIHNTAHEGDMELVEVSCQPGDVDEVIGYTTAQAVLELDTRAGGSYCLVPEDFHTSIAVGPTITEVVRGEVVAGKARLVRPVGAAFTCPFSVDRGVEACWEEIARMLGG